MKVYPQKYPIDASEPYHCIDNPLDRGMDLRDYFAAKAMQGFFSIYGNIRVDKGNTKVKFIAENSYVLADAMMKAKGNV